MPPAPFKDEGNYYHVARRLAGDKNPPKFLTVREVLEFATVEGAVDDEPGAFLVNELSDQYIVGYAFREFAAQSLRAGEGFPLWNPYQFGGMPYVAAMHGDVFYPTFLLRMLLPTDVAMT